MASKNRSGAYCAWHSFWCVIATLILIGCIAFNLAVRSYIKSDRLATAVGDLTISTVTVDDKTVAEHIREEFVSDDAVKVTDIETAINGMGIEAFAEKKLSAMGKLLRGESDDVVHITVDEIIALLEKSEYDLYNDCLLVIEDSDKQELRNELDGPLGVFNKVMTVMFGSPAMRMVSRYCVSTACLIVNIVLLILVLWRWIVVRKNADKTGSGACKGMGLTILIPSALTFVATAVYVISGLFTPDGAQTLHVIGNVIVNPYWGISVLGIVSGVLLMLAAAAMRRIAANQRDKTLANTTAVAPVKMEAVENIAKPDPFTAPLPESAAPAAPPAAATTPCIACARALAEGSRFCIYCGAPQTPPAPPAAADETSAPAEAPSVIAETAETPEVSETQPQPEEDLTTPISS